MSVIDVTVPTGRGAAITAMRLGRLPSHRGGAGVHVGVVDGPVDAGHPDLADAQIVNLRARGERPRGRDAAHATFVAGLMCASGNSVAPGLCPEVSLFSAPVTLRSSGPDEGLDADSLLDAVATCLDAGVNILNLSLEFVRPDARTDRRFAELMNHAALRGVLVVRATGNDARVSGGIRRQHSWPIRVIAYTPEGRPATLAHIGSNLGLEGVGGPGWDTAGLGLAGGYQVLAGTSVATAYVTAALALLWSAYPARSAASIRAALQAINRRARCALPAMLDMAAVCQEME